MSGTMECGRCPYCGQRYFNQLECPEHELTLVPVDPSADGSSADADEGSSVTFFADPRLGRGPVLLGASLALVGFLLPFAGWAESTASALEVSVEAAKNLWLTPLAALAQLAILWQRRTALRMHAARFAVAGLSVGGVLPLFYTTWRVRTVAAAAGQAVDWLSGLWLMSFGFALAAFGARQLGRQRGAGPQAERAASQVP